MVTSSARRDAVFRAIADPTRREILTLLRDGRRSVGELASNFSQSRPAISKHLRSLRSAGLVVLLLLGDEPGDVQPPSTPGVELASSDEHEVETVG